MSEDWVRAEIMAALRDGLRSGSEGGLAEVGKEASAREWADLVLSHQADAIMATLERVASRNDTYHMLVAYMNTLRLRNDYGEDEPEEDEPEEEEKEHEPW